MRNTIILFLLCGLVFISSAQHFEIVNEVDLPEGFTGKDLHWLDMNQDGLMDLVVLANDATGNHFLLLYQNNDPVLSYAGQLTTGMQQVVTAFADMNRDGQKDIILSGRNESESYTTVLYHTGDFSFSLAEQPIIMQSGSLIHLADLDQDGRKELILSGTDNNQPFFRIFTEQISRWTLSRDSVKVHASFVGSFDFDQDGVNDLFVSGLLADASPYHAIILNDRQMNFTELSRLDGITEVAPWLADINYDGVFDVVMAGRNNEGEGTVMALRSLVNVPFQVQEISTLDFVPQHLFVADLDSDGKVDLQVTGKNNTDMPFNKIFFDNGTSEDLPGTEVTIQRFGDFDYDGDLDLVQLQGTNGNRLVQYVNNAGPDNLIPASPSNPAVALIFDRLFMYWDEPFDDHTPTPSLTYDITLQTPEADVVSGDFDLIVERRLQVTHGNNGTLNYAFFRNFNFSDFQYFIQAVDNAYHAGPSICKGSGSNWTELAEEKIIVCGNESALLTAGSEALWFSLNKGLIGQSQELLYKPDAADTVFSLVRDGATSTIKLYTIEIRENYVEEFLRTIYACENEVLPFEAAGEWAHMEWSSTLNGFLSNEASISYTVTQVDTVKLFLSDGEGCGELHLTAIQISKPEITLNGEAFHILKGSDIQLIASGGSQYAWQPPAGLSHTDIFNPNASPQQTTEYTVTVTDSIGCTASAKVLVIVESTAFIPNLFTPNQDGTNDLLRIYGLAPVRSFSFSIYNREGSMVYSTSNATEATQSGWDGSSRGVFQPAGVYYWKVKGEYDNGSKLLLNGKENGSVVLIR